MNIQIIATLLQTVLSLIPSLTTSKSINNIVSTLIQLLPTVVKEAEQLLPMVQNIIAALRSNGAITPDQLTALDALDAQVDAQFEAAVAAYLANHPVPAANPTTAA